MSRSLIFDAGGTFTVAVIKAAASRAGLRLSNYDTYHALWEWVGDLGS